MNQELAEKRWWDEWNTSYRSEDNVDEISTRLFSHVAGIVKRLSEERTRRILEVACGTGTLSRRLVFSSYYGLDVSQSAIEIACRKAETLSTPASTERPTYEVADIHDWLLPDRPFDVAICVDAVAYFRDQQLALNRIAEALNSTGRLILTTINPFVYNRIRRTARSPLKEGSISRWLSRGQLHGLVTSAGFRVDRSYTIIPRGNVGLLRIINARRLNHVFGARGAEVMCHWKEKVGLGQYRVVEATKMS
jgi:2-polyprenyl-3-methyl-5-hydroxy-6-metoxy-1,4-benzoquinol methylase